MCPEIVKEPSIPRPLTTTTGMSQRRAEGLTQMFVAGVSTQKVGEVAQTLIGVAPSASSVSRLNQSLTEQFEAWRERALQAHYRVM
jgi:putative transposase